VIKQAAVVVVLLSLSACGGGASDPAATGAAATAGATTSASSATGVPSTAADTSPASAPAKTTGKASTKPALDGSSAVSVSDQLCVFLDQEQLKVQDVSSGFVAKARLSVDFKSWTAKDRDRKVKTSEVDAIASSQCPKVRARILTAVSAKTLTAALS
jgi:hypothetical protein